MSEPFFQSADRIEALRRECARWRGTPWSRSSEISNLKSAIASGADCVTIAAAIYTACGFDLAGFEPRLPSVLLPPDAARAFVLAPLHRLAAAGRALHLPDIKKHSILPGDLLLFEAAPMLSLGIAVGDSLYYATAARPGGRWNIHTLDAKPDSLTDAWRPLAAPGDNPTEAV